MVRTRGSSSAAWATRASTLSVTSTEVPSGSRRSKSNCPWEEVGNRFTGRNAAAARLKANAPAEIPSTRPGRARAARSMPG